MSLGQEVILFKARLGDKRKQLAKLNGRAEDFIILLRNIIDPSVEDSNDLDLPRAHAIIEDFMSLNDEKLKLKADILKMEREING